MNTKNDKFESGRFAALTLVLSVLLVIYACWAGAVGLTGSMGIAAFMALALLFFSRLDRFEIFKASAGGFEARTRAVVREAEATLQQLRELATLVSKIEVMLMVRHGRIGSFGEEERKELLAEVLSLLDRMGVAKDEQSKVNEDVHRFAVHDYVFDILGGAQLPNAPLHPSTHDEWIALRSRALTNPPTPEELTAFLAKNSWLTDERKQVIEDYRAYLHDQHHQGPEAFSSLGSRRLGV